MYLCPHNPMRAKITTILGCILMGTGVTHAATQQRSPLDIRHAYLVTGAQTAIISETDQILWRYPRSTRDGFVLESGNVLLVLKAASIVKIVCPANLSLASS